MPLDAKDQEIIDRFRAWCEQEFGVDERWGAPTRHDREDGSLLATRFKVADSLWLEAALRPQIPQFRAGLVTDDRWTSEDLEQTIEDSGDTMSEFVELGFDEVDLAWTDPIVEHYREGGQYFYFSTGLDLDRLSQLDDAALREKASKMVRGYYEAFREAIEKANAA
jgi:hypothetical protein